MRVVSLPLFPGMRDEERQHVIDVVRGLCLDRRKGASEWR